MQDDVLKNLHRRDDVVLMFIDGEFTAASDGGARDCVNPANGDVIVRVAEGTTADAQRAILAAHAAFHSGPWGESSAQDRAKLLNALADSIDEHAEELSRLETLNNGKPLRETQYDMADAANCFRYYAGYATKPHGQTFDVPAASQTFTVREPIGVCGQIIPWNYPLLMAAWKLAPALAAGNTCILKPSEITPLTALRLADLIARAGFPKGVVNILTGAGPVVGHALAASDLVDKIAFTGGTKTGRSIMQAIDYALFGIYANAGQVCSAWSRLIVQDSVHDRFVKRLVERAKKIIVGDGFDPAVEMGPLVSRAHRDKVEAYIKLGLEEGATLECGGERLSGDLGANGNFLVPTIFSNTKPTMRIVQEEIFGPVLVVQRFTDEAEAIALANDTIYGLAGAVFTSDIARAHRVIRKLRAGITWINTYHPTYNEAPWGGYKQSGIGRELGTYGYDAYTEVKQINVNLTVEPSGWFADR
jgi:betaine-aldehyde dehydrogenase